MKFFISAGEASGDIHGAPLIEQLALKAPGSEFIFLGGDEMAKAAGHAPLIHYRDMAFMAFSEVLRNLGKILGNLSAAKKAIAASRPDALILIDYPSFNLKLARYACSLGIPVYYYISPKVWAWKEWRVKDIRRYCRKVLSILPFEVDYFHKKGMEVEYVGNPSVEEVDTRRKALPPEAEFIARWNLTPGKPLLALVPGSRRGEIRNNLPIMAAVAARFPQLQPVIAGAPAIEPEFYRSFSSLPVVTDATFELVSNATAALVTSGTATLEAALLATPQVVCYRANGSRLSYRIMRRLIKVDFVALPNLIAGKEIVPELLLHFCTPDAVASALGNILPGSPGREAQIQGYALMRKKLGESTSAASAADAILRSLR